MLQRVIYGGLHYGKDVLLMIGGGETLCYVAFVGTAVAFISLLLATVLKKPPTASVDIAYALNKTTLLQRAFRLIANGWFLISLASMGIDAFTPPSPFLRPELVLGYCALYFAFAGILQGILLWVTHAVNGRLAFRYRLAKLTEERRMQLRLQTERAQVFAVEKENADLPNPSQDTAEGQTERGEQPKVSEKAQAEERAKAQAEMEGRAQAEEKMQIPLPIAPPQTEEREIPYATCGISAEGVTDLLNRAKNLPFSEVDALRYKKIELAVRDALAMSNPPGETLSSLLAALLKLYAKYGGQCNLAVDEIHAGA